MLSRSMAMTVVACTAAPQATAFVAAPLPVARLGAARSTATRPAVHALRATAAAGVNTASGVVPGYGDLTNVQLSGLNGKALKDKEFPSIPAVKKAMPEGTWVRDDKVLRCACASVCQHVIVSMCIRATWSKGAPLDPGNCAWQEL